jgi:hypothetical protein
MFLPPKLLPITITSIDVNELWTEDDGTGDPWLGYPYRWAAQIAVTPQQHSSHLTSTPYYYDGMDIGVGDWFSDIATGFAVQIVDFVEQTASTVTVICEDVDRFNTRSNPTGSGMGIGYTGQGFLFQIGEDGLPILAGMTTLNTALQGNLAWQMDQISRFRYRNLLHSYYRVRQPSHSFVVGDIVRLQSTGLYVKVVPGSSNVETAVGAVTSVSVPGPSWFSYRPIGRVITNIAPELPGNPGSLVYLAENEAFTALRPTQWAKPVYIRLETGKTGIFLDRGVEAAGDNGYASQVQIISNPLSLSSINANPGDQVFVANGPNGEWTQYIRGVSGEWKVLMTQDASHTDAQTVEKDITFNSETTDLIYTVSDGSRVAYVSVEVIETFNPASSLTIGTPLYPDLLMTNDLLDLGNYGTYTANPATAFNYGTDVDITFTFDPAGSTTGRAKIIITYV